MTTITVYYDASCPLCTREMSSIKALDHAGAITLRDCSAPDFVDAEANAAGIERSAMMRLIHARKESGQWLLGVDVFIELYQRVGLHSVAGFWAHPRFTEWLRRLYPWIARNRQVLSKLGVIRIYEWAIARAAKRALAQSQRCSADRCELPPNH